MYVHHTPLLHFMFMFRVAQSKSAIEKVQDEEYEMSKPLARYADDEDLEKMLKERQREGDPMLLFSKRMGKGLPSKKKKGLSYITLH